MRDRPQPPRVAETHGVQDQALAVVEAQPQLPVLPAQQPALERKGNPVGLADLQWLHLAQRHRDELGQVLAHDAGRVVGLGLAFEAVLQFQQHHPVEVDDRVQPGDVVRVRAAVRAAAVPHVGPADPQPAVALGDERGAVGPDVGQHQGHVGDVAPGQRRDQLRVRAEHLVALVPLVHGHVRVLAVLQPLPAGDRAVGQGDHRPVGPAVLPVPAHGQGLAARAADSRRAALAGSTSSIEANRQRGGSTPRSRRSTAATLLISSAVSGSSGCPAARCSAAECSTARCSARGGSGVPTGQAILKDCGLIGAGCCGTSGVPANWARIPVIHCLQRSSSWLSSVCRRPRVTSAPRSAPG